MKNRMPNQENRRRFPSAFQRSRRQIVAVVMAAFLIVFVVTLAMIYFLSYQELYQENQDMLDSYVQQYRENGNPSQSQPEQLPQAEEPPERGELPDHDSARYLLSSFYSVAFDAQGDAFSVDVGSGTLYSQSQLTDVALALLSGSKSQGTYGNFIYRIDETESYTLVALMDSTLVADSFTTLFRNALLLGAAMVLVLYLCAVALARWIIRPLEESDRRQRQFLSDAGHELKTPVSVVQANAELLEREIGENKWLRNIRFESNRMTGLVSELLELVRAERDTPGKEPLELSRLVLGGVLPFESVAYEMGRTLDYRIDEGISLLGNPGQLSELVSILMDNALSHSEGEGAIAISLRQERGEAILTVTNPGFIPEQKREDIFARFYRSDENRSDTGHYGLGLSIAKKIVEAHHGGIGVECADGQVVFTVRLPLHGKKHRASRRTAK